MKKILYIDLDNVLVDFPSGISRISEDLRKKFGDELDNVPGIFALMNPIPGAIETYKKLSEKYDTYILSTSPWANPSAWSDKLEWVKKYLGEVAYKRLILTHHKDLNRGDYLIDDREKNGAKNFNGELILFGSEKFPDWDAVSKYLLKLSEGNNNSEFLAQEFTLSPFYQHVSSGEVTEDDEKNGEKTKKEIPLLDEAIRPKRLTDIIDNIDLYVSEMRKAKDIETIPKRLNQYAWEYFREIPMSRDDLKLLAVFVVDKTYRVISELREVDNYTRVFFSTVIPYLWDALQNRGIDIFYVLDNELRADRFKMTVELFRLTGMAVVTPNVSSGDLSFEEVKKQILDYMAPVRHIMYAEKDSSVNYLLEVIKLGEDTKYLRIFRNNSPEDSNVTLFS